MLKDDTLLRDRYRIIRHLSKGGMGTVYLAKDENLGVTVAIKQNSFDDPHLIEAFKREARLLAGLRHPALPQVKDYFINEAGQFLVMEYIAGDDLGTVLDKRAANIAPAGKLKPFEVDDILNWAEQLLDTLVYLHTRPEPVVHRDIKPQNLKLAEGDQIILLDFGLAKGKPQGMTRVTTTGSIYGYTPTYAPLEQIRGAGTDPRSDLYALGATLYHLITGTPPVDALTRADAMLGGEPDPLQPANEINQKVPQGVAELLKAAMEQTRNKRPAAAAEMLEMLRAAKLSTVIDQRARKAVELSREIVAQPEVAWPVTEIETDQRIAEEQKRIRAAEQGRQQEESEKQIGAETQTLLPQQLKEGNNGTGSAADSARVKSSEPVLSTPNPAPLREAQSSANVNQKVALKMAGLILILIGIGLLVYQIIHPSTAQLAPVQSGGSGQTAPSTVIWWPSGLLFLVGGGLWKAGR